MGLYAGLYHAFSSLLIYCCVVTVEMKRSIAIFPIYAAEGKSQSQVVMYSVRRCFEAMLRRYPRNSKILEEITSDQAIDILLELRPGDEQGDDGRSSPNIPVTTSGINAVVSSPIVTAAVQNTVTLMSTVPHTPQLAPSRFVLLLCVKANCQTLCGSVISLFFCVFLLTFKRNDH